MDKKKKISGIKALFITLLFVLTIPTFAQDVSEIRFEDKNYEYGIGKDSITLFLKVLGSNGIRCNDVYADDIRKHFNLMENDDTIPKSTWTVTTLTEGQRIPSDFTISVLVDLSIPQSGKKDIYEAVKTLVESAHDSCVYLSFFGDWVSKSHLVTKRNYKEFEDRFYEQATSKYFYCALYAKLTEFNFGYTEYDTLIKTQSGYQKDERIFIRAKDAREKNLLFVFTEGNEIPQFEELDFIKITDYQGSADIRPKVYAFFYDAGNGIDENVERTLNGVSHPRDSEHNLIPSCQGDYKSSDNIKTVLQEFEQAIRNEMYDFALAYHVPQDRSYSGKVQYTALWDEETKGSEIFSIGSPEKTWPVRRESAGSSALKYLIALLVAFLTVLLFIAVMKIIIPGIKSAAFSTKYYKKFKLADNVKTMTCPMCRCEIQPGQKVVKKCRHIIHVKCWKANGYKCVEYGQNCKEGIQDHVHWDSLFSKETLRDCFLTIMGVCASLVSWVIYEITGRGFFNGLATAFFKAFFKANGQSAGIVVNECIAKVSSFLTIGLLLGFFLSFIFRYFDSVKSRDFKWFVEITGLSLLSSLIGMASFALGSVILCLWMSPTDTFIPWYCSFPAYLLFSVCTTLSLTIKSTIPFKSALIGGLVSAIIGFIVLYFSNISTKRWDWMNMLLDFVIYGGGLGASLITVRMLAEKYFLVIQNGVRSGLRIPIHKWMNAGNMVTIGMTQQCEIQMAWEKSNKVAKEHVQLYVNQSRSQAMLKPYASTIYNMRTEIDASSKPVPLFNGDTFKIGDTIFKYVEN